MNWEARFKALVRRLVEIADLDTPLGLDDPDRLDEYDLVARAHEKDIGEEEE